MLFGKPKNDPKEDPKNRRKFDRVPSRNLIRVLRPDGAEVERLSNVYDLSEGGVRLVCHETLPVNTPLRVILNLPEESATLELSGRVAWTCPMKGQKGAFFAGIEFLNTSEKDREILRRSVERRFPGAK